MTRYEFLRLIRNAPGSTVWAVDFTKEYFPNLTYIDDSDLIEHLSKFGLSGWHIVLGSPMLIVLERVKPADTDVAPVTMHINVPEGTTPEQIAEAIANASNVIAEESAKPSKNRGFFGSVPYDPIEEPVSREDEENHGI